MLSTFMLASFVWILSSTPDDTPLSDWYGFQGMEVLPVGDDPGPMLVADVDGDGLLDIIAGNNRRSRIEILRQRPADEVKGEGAPAPGINEFPEHPRWERRLIPVQDQIAGIIVHDLTGDGRGDLLLGGAPGRISILLQHEDGTFSKERHRDVRGLSPSPAAFSLADIAGDDGLELVSIVEGDLVWWPLTGTRLGPIERRPAGVKLAAVVPDDYDGDGMIDIAGIAPDDEAPVRIWFSTGSQDTRAPGGQVPFEMPPIVEFEAVTAPDAQIAKVAQQAAGNTQDAARIAVIERPARRIVLYDVIRETAGEDPAVELFGFADGGNRDRAVVLADVDGDGMLDVVSADTHSSAITVHSQRPTGLGAPDASPTVADVDGLAIIPAGDDEAAQLIVLSTKEGFVGRSALGTGGPISFPTAIAGEQGWAPRAVGVVQIEGKQVPAIVRNNGRKYILEVSPLDGAELAKVDLGSLSRSPDSVFAIDADQDGLQDVLLLTDDRPMMMVLAEADGAWTVLEKDDMPQNGLVGAGTAAAVTGLDIDGDGLDEILTADRNYVRGLRYHRDGPAPGWQVVEQINVDDPDARLSAITSMNGAIVAADQESNTLILIERGEDGWEQTDSIDLHGVQPRSLRSGALDGEGGATILALGEESMATVSRAGSRHVLQEAGSWRSPLEDHAPHELAVGDVNADGRADMVALDAGEQMLEILTFTDDRAMLHATGFPVFESRLFSGGEGLQYQPRQVAIADVTGDGRKDVILLVHDRIVLYPQ